MCLELCMTANGGPFNLTNSICHCVEDQNEVLFEITAESNPPDDSKTPKNEYRFVCERGCGFKTNHKGSFTTHLNKKKPCQPPIPGVEKNAENQYVCPRNCGYKTHIKNDLTRHLNRKKPCEPPIPGVEKNAENQYVCPRNCGYKTSEKSDLTRHLNRKKPCKPQVPDDMKICCKCNVTKLKTEFHTHSMTKDGLYSWCKACVYESRTCEHGNLRDRCPECIDFSKGIPKKLCKICLETQVCGKRIEIGICAGCDTNKAPRIEIKMRHLIKKYVGHEASSIDTTIANDNQMCENMTKHRPDITFADTTVVIVVEIDEDGGHPNRESDCESKKITSQNEAIQKIPMYENIPVITLRFNPDQYNGSKIPSTEEREKRAKEVSARIRELLDCYSDKEPERNGYYRVEYFYYHEKAHKHIEHQKKYSDVCVYPEGIFYSLKLRERAKIHSMISG